MQDEGTINENDWTANSSSKVHAAECGKEPSLTFCIEILYCKQQTFRKWLWKSQIQA